MTIVSRTVRCFCRCHFNDDDNGAAWRYGVDGRDVMACVLACSECRGNHAAVLDDPIGFPLPEPPRPADATGTVDDD